MIAKKAMLKNHFRFCAKGNSAAINGRQNKKVSIKNKRVCTILSNPLIAKNFDVGNSLPGKTSKISVIIKNRIGKKNEVFFIHALLFCNVAKKRKGPPLAPLPSKKPR